MDDAADIRHPAFARLYHRTRRHGEPDAMLAARRELLAGTSGRVVDVGAGDGANFPFAPPAVTELVAVEPEPYLRALAERAAAQAPVPVVVTAGRAERLPLEDGSADAVVFALVLCSVDDQAAALAEVRRVLRPGGELRVLEHVVSEQRAGAALQRLLQATVWPRALGNCHPARDTLAAIRQAGFDTRGIRRPAERLGPAFPPLPHILGTAIAP